MCVAGYRGLSVPVNNRLCVCGRLQGAECSCKQTVCGRLQGLSVPVNRLCVAGYRGLSVPVNRLCVWQVTGG